jgi:hypothetical protein
MIELIIIVPGQELFMSQNRLQALQDSPPVGVAFSHRHFVFCPAVWVPFVPSAQLGWLPSVYELALEQARAAVAAPLQQKLFSIWN